MPFRSPTVAPQPTGQPAEWCRHSEGSGGIHFEFLGVRSHDKSYWKLRTQAKVLEGRDWSLGEGLPRLQEEGQRLKMKPCSKTPTQHILGLTVPVGSPNLTAIRVLRGTETQSFHVSLQFPTASGWICLSQLSCFHYSLAKFWRFPEMSLFSSHW